MEFLKHVDSFVRCCIKEPLKYTPGSVTNVEGFYWWSLISEYRPELIFESGIGQGRSTEILSRAAREFGVKTHLAFDIDSSSVKNGQQRTAHPSLCVHLSSLKAVKECRKQIYNMRCVVIVDGPKKAAPICSLVSALNETVSLQAVGCHDCRPGSPSRLGMMLSHKRIPRMNLLFTMMNTFDYLNSSIVQDIKRTHGRTPWYLRKLYKFVGLMGVNL